MMHGKSHQCEPTRQDARLAGAAGQAGQVNEFAKSKTPPLAGCKATTPPAAGFDYARRFIASRFWEWWFTASLFDEVSLNYMLTVRK